MKTIAITNQKGGVGKTTTTFELADAARLAGLTVLVIDADPQGNLTSSMSKDDLPGDNVGLADVLAGEEQITRAVVPGLWPGVDLLPTVSPALTTVRNQLMATPEPGREHRLANALEEVRGTYDLVLIDCPPSLDQLTINALTAADSVLIVTHAKQWSIDGLSELLRTIGLVRQHLNIGLGIEGILVNQVEENTRGNAYWANELTSYAEAASLRLLDQVIPKRVAIADSIESSTSLTEWPAPKASDLLALYTQLVKEIAA